jgi:hypothetical protein
METTVYRPGKTPRRVQNLGWLLRHWEDVRSFTLAKLPSGAPSSAFMVAHLRDGGEYRVDWADIGVMLNWLRRPVFRGVTGTSPEEVIEIELKVKPEDVEVRGNALASGDDAQDKAAEDAILERLARDDWWAWCCVVVRGTCGDYEAFDSLGACTYEDERDFMREGGYFDDMVLSVMGQIHAARVAALGG